MDKKSQHPDEQSLLNDKNLESSGGDALLKYTPLATDESNIEEIDLNRSTNVAPPVIVNQPQQILPMEPINLPTIPGGLEYLATVDQLLIKQKVEVFEVLTGFETNNKFVIENTLGQTVFRAFEDTNCCIRNICGPVRPFDMKIMDNYQKEVIHLFRDLACQTCCFPCCLQNMEVATSPSCIIGHIEQEWSLCLPAFRIKSGAGETVLRIEGPFWKFSMCGDVEFRVLTVNGEQIGKISKQWSGLLREIFSDADNYVLTFPLDLDVKMKAILLGACFLIDAMFFEKAGGSLI